MSDPCSLGIYHEAEKLIQVDLVVGRSLQHIIHLSMEHIKDLAVDDV